MGEPQLAISRLAGNPKHGIAQVVTLFGVGSANKGEKLWQGQ
jgi:hypothetical protein